jgi:hypothetical protein
MGVSAEALVAHPAGRAAEWECAAAVIGNSRGSTTIQEEAATNPKDFMRSRKHFFVRDIRVDQGSFLLIRPIRADSSSPRLVLKCR